MPNHTHFAPTIANWAICVATLATACQPCMTHARTTLPALANASMPSHAHLATWSANWPTMTAPCTTAPALCIAHDAKTLPPVISASTPVLISAGSRSRVNTDAIPSTIGPIMGQLSLIHWTARLTDSIACWSRVHALAAVSAICATCSPMAEAMLVMPPRAGIVGSSISSAVDGDEAISS